MLQTLTVPDLSPDPQVPADTSLGTLSSHPRGGYIPPRCHILSVVARYEASLTSQSRLTVGHFCRLHPCFTSRHLSTPDPSFPLTNGDIAPRYPGFSSPPDPGPPFLLATAQHPWRPSPLLHFPTQTCWCAVVAALCFRTPRFFPGSSGLSVPSHLLHVFHIQVTLAPDPILPTIPAYVSSATHFSPSAHCGKHSGTAPKTRTRTHRADCHEASSSCHSAHGSIRGCWSGTQLVSALQHLTGDEAKLSRTPAPAFTARSRSSGWVAARLLTSGTQDGNTNKAEAPAT